jgi:hypothetical protein
MAHGVRRLSLGVAMLVSLSGSALAQPALVRLGMIAEDISADGTKAVGYVVDTAAGEGYVPYVFTRGSGSVAVPGGVVPGNLLRGSSDLTVFATGLKNTSNWGNLNCFAGYCAFGDCVPGAPLAPPTPCQIPDIAHRWTSAGGWVNLGSVPRFADPVTGRFFGGTRCDNSTSSPNDISGNGQVVVGGAWSTGLLSPSGGPSFGLCGDLVAFKFDAATGVMTTLPVQPGTTTSRADSVNGDGTVITGYDFGQIPDEFGPFDGRRICVWVNGTQTIIDGLSNSFATYPVNAAGTVIAGTPSAAFNSVNFTVNDVGLVKWTRQPNNTWTPTYHGRPIDLVVGEEVKPLSQLLVTAVSDDGNTIVGRAQYGFGFFDRVTRPFIWKATVNGGVPLDFATYLSQLAPGSPLVQPGLNFVSINGMSTDGNALLVALEDARNTCPGPTASLATGDHGIVYLNGAGVACGAPVIAVPPRDSVSEQYTPFGAVLNVSVSGSFPMTYTWQREVPGNPNTWVNLTEACSGFPFGGDWDYEGVDKNQLRIGQQSCGANRAGRYRVIVSNACGSVTSTPATVSFQQGITINQQPENATACGDSPAFMFAVGVANTSEILYTWEVATSAAPSEFTVLQPGANVLSDGRTLTVSGATSQFVSITPSDQAGTSTYQIRCVMLSACGNATSNAATLTVNRCRCTLSDVAGPNQSEGPDLELTADDIIVFLGWYFAGDFRADVAGANQSTQPDFEFTADDIIVFLGRYFQGC